MPRQDKTSDTAASKSSCAANNVSGAVASCGSTTTATCRSKTRAVMPVLSNPVCVRYRKSPLNDAACRSSSAEATVALVSATSTSTSSVRPRLRRSNLTFALVVVGSSPSTVRSRMTGYALERAGNCSSADTISPGLPLDCVCRSSQISSLPTCSPTAVLTSESSAS